MIAKILDRRSQRVIGYCVIERKMQIYSIKGITNEMLG